MSHSAEFEALCEEARSQIRETSIEEVHGRQQIGAPFVLVDVREDNEWERGHVTGAIHLGRGIIERDIVAAIPAKDTEIVLYCGGGFRSALSAENLQKMGYENVWSMAGGWRAWTTAGYSTELS
jgi:rhodanese-related sulfurtransferase